MEYFDKNIHQEIDMRKGYVKYKKISAREITGDIRWLDNFGLTICQASEFLMMHLRGANYFRDRVFGYTDITEEMNLFFQSFEERQRRVAPPKPEKAYFQSITDRAIYYSFGHYVGLDIANALLLLLLYKQGKHKNLCLAAPNANRSPMLAAHRYTYKYSYTITK